MVRGKGRQSFVLDGPPHRKMVKVLEGHIREPQNFMRDVVEKTSHPGSPQTPRLRLQIEYLTDHSRFPVEPPVIKRQLLYVFPEPGYHCRREDTVSRELLVSARASAFISKITLPE